MVSWFVVTPSNQRVPQSPPCAAMALRQRVDGVYGRGGLRALVALRFVLVLLHRVLANERAILVELAIAAFAVVHQTVIAFLHVAVQRRLAALQRLVVLVTAAKEDEQESQRLKWEQDVVTQCSGPCRPHRHVLKGESERLWGLQVKK